MAENKTLEHLPEVRAAVAALSPEDRKLLAAVQASPFKLTAPEQFKEFAANIDYFVFEPNIHDLNDLGWRYLAQHMDMLLPPELLKAIDPVPFGKYAMQEEQGHFSEHGYISLSGDEWNHERPAEPEKKPSIRERLEQGKGKELLPLSVIDAARDGDSQAVDQVLRYYEGYINKLCTRTLYDPDGQPHVRVDEYMKRRLEIKLIHSIVSMN